jgi:small subunit ribosomal protein S17
MSTEEQKREHRASVTGTVTSTRMKDTIVVREQRMVRHPLYGKYVRRHTKYHAHDAGNTAAEGDEVEIVQTRPISKTKNWRLLRIVRKGTGGVAHADTDVADTAAAKPAAGSGA